MTKTSNTPLHTSSSARVRDIPRIFSHSVLGLASACALLALIAAGCAGDELTENSGFGSGGASSTSTPGGAGASDTQCTSEQECLESLANFDYLSEACVLVSCEEGQCRFDSSTMNGGSCDDGDLCTTNDVCFSGECGGAAVDCSDEDPCTADLCLSETGQCDHPISVGASCDDDLACTVDDTCDSGGSCAGSPTASCECTGDSDCASQSSEDLCDGIFTCQADYTCAYDPDTRVICPEELNTDCTTGSCIPETGECVASPISEGEACTAENNPCIDTGNCLEGVCTSDVLIDCDDDDPCTIDTCDPEAGGCVHAPNQGESCDDGDPCTTEDTCLADSSCLGSPVSCVDDNSCTEGSCDPETGECAFEPVEGPCNDGAPCTLNDICQEGVCVGEAKDCNDDNACTDDQCVESTGKCASVAVLDLSPCDLDNPCTQEDFCLSGVCTAGESACECEVDEDCASYNTEDPCSPDYYCDLDVFPIVCAPDMTTVPSCEDSGVPCRQNICVSETGDCALVELADGVTCDDGDPCSYDGYCYDGSCAATAVDCEDGDPCTANLCSTTGCYVKLLDEGEKLLETTFDQGYPAGWTIETDNEDVTWAPSGAYAAGEGGLGMVVTGPSGNYDGPVEAWLRSPWFHVYGEELELRYKVRTALAQSGCGTDALQVGIEAFGIFTPLQLICQTQTEWTDQVVDLTAYKNLRVQLAFRFLANDTQNAGFGAAIDAVEIDALFSCIDDDICTTGEICQEGSCDLAEVACDDGDPCTADACSPTEGCVHIPQDVCVCELATDCPLLGPCAVPSCVEGICEAIFIDGACDTGDECTTNGECAEGVCVGDTLICSDDDPCTSDLCDSEVGCQFVPHEEDCDDGDACTTDDQCLEGVCTGTPKVCDTGNPCAMGICTEGDCWAEPLHDGQVLIGDDFDGVGAVGLPPGWSQENSHPAWSWSANSASSLSEPNAVALTGPTTWSEEPVTMRLYSPEFNVGVHGATLNFNVSMALGDESCVSDTLTLRVGNSEVSVLCESTDDWVEIALELPPSDGPVTMLFEAHLATDTASAVDIRLDDIEVLANYPCATEDPCLDGVCVVGACMTQAVPNCP